MVSIINTMDRTMAIGIESLRLSRFNSFKIIFLRNKVFVTFYSNHEEAIFSYLYLPFKLRYEHLAQYNYR